MGNGERGMSLIIYHEILHSEQLEGAEFIDDNSFLWFLTPANVGTCHLSGRSSGRRTANASILMKFCTLRKSIAVNSMVTIGFRNFWCLSILIPVNVGTCHLLGHIVFNEEQQMHQFWWNFVLYTNRGWGIQ